MQGATGGRPGARRGQISCKTGHALRTSHFHLVRTLALTARRILLDEEPDPEDLNVRLK